MDALKRSVRGGAAARRQETAAERAMPRHRARPHGARRSRPSKAQEAGRAKLPAQGRVRGCRDAKRQPSRLSQESAISSAPPSPKERSTRARWPAQGRQATLPDPEARRDAAALRFPPGMERHADELGGAERAERKPGRQAARRPCRGSPARLRRFRRHHPERRVWRRHRDAVGRRHLGAAATPMSTRRCRRASSASRCTASGCKGKWALVRCAARAETTRTTGC